ncbi:hypothetical protein IKQ21_04115 [bacterium]|nr:hypothetical protein [bacterium]
MPGPEVKPFAGYYSYNTLNSNPIESDNLLLIGTIAKFNTGTTVSTAVGGFIKQGSKPLLELKASQHLFNTGNVNFKAQTRGRFFTDGTTQLRGAVEASYPLKNGVTPYLTTHFTSKDGKQTVGGWFGASYKNVSAEIQVDRGLQTHKTGVMANFIVNI